ncbi:MAG: alpha/beta fold hydrolase [Flavobacteriaceae bacterium]|nr:alpha/beta fold hydrolase [Flavobacteriaceae bacterium]
MPVVPSSYQPPFWFRQMDLVTIYSARLRSLQKIDYQRERIDLPDGDFIDLDWSFSRQNTKKCIILLHGLEGSSQSRYNLALANLFNSNSLDVCAVNFRGCSGQPNLKYICYHSGKTDDVEFIVNQIVTKTKYDQLFLHGVSLGGNVLLKYLGENKNLPIQIKSAMAVSTPCDLSGSSRKLLNFRNQIYTQNFTRQLLQKLKTKQQQFPEMFELNSLKAIRNVLEFDELYTSKAHGFTDAEDYYQKSSSLQFLEHIRIPTLLLNAQNDSFLSKESFPYTMAENHPFLYLETPKYGGHAAFWQPGGIYYNEQRALEFAQEFMK